MAGERSSCADDVVALCSKTLAVQCPGVRRPFQCEGRFPTFWAQMGTCAHLCPKTKGLAEAKPLN